MANAVKLFNKLMTFLEKVMKEVEAELSLNKTKKTYLQDQIDDLNLSDVELKELKRKLRKFLD